MYREVTKYAPNQLLQEYAPMLFLHQYLSRKSVMAVEERPLINFWEECLKREQKRLADFTEFIVNIFQIINGSFSTDQWPSKEFNNFLENQIEAHLFSRASR